MKPREKQNINLEKETKEKHNKHETGETVELNLRSKKHDPSTGQTQYPAKIGFHGTQDEKELNPEE